MTDKEEIIKHLEIVQGVINRLAHNSFLIKGWSMTILAAAILFIARSNDYSENLIFAFIIPVVSFWILDGYFLWQERLFRGIYDDVRMKEKTNFNMDIPTQLKKPKNKWRNSIFSLTLNIFLFNRAIFYLGSFLYSEEFSMRKVFFSFDWDDVWRVNQVRNSWVSKRGYQNAGFVDKAEIETLKRNTDRAIKNWIDKQMYGTSVTCILIGEKTHKSKWVKYEIEQSIKKGNGLIGILIHELKDNKGNISSPGASLLTDYSNDSIDKKIKRILVSSGIGYGLARLLFPQFAIPIIIASTTFGLLNNNDYKIYNWINNDGYKNLSHWIEKAAKQADR